MEALSSDNDCFMWGGGYFIAAWIGAIPALIVATIARRKIREGKRLDASNPVADFFTVCCCGPCALAQEAHEVGLGSDQFTPLIGQQ